MDTKNLAQKLLDIGILNEGTYSLQDLFRIRDALMVLAFYGLEDKNLLTEVQKYINQKGDEK